MKVIIWVHREEVVNGNITKYYNICPQPGYENYVQVIISADDFTKLEDNRWT